MTHQIDQQPTPVPDTRPRPRSLTDQVKSWVAPPSFPEDQEKTRQAAILNTVLIAPLVGSILYGVSLPLRGAIQTIPVIFVLSILTIAVFGLMNIRRGNVTPTIYLVTFSAWLVSAGASAVFGGVSSPVYASFLIIIILNGLMLGYWAAIITAGSGVLYGLLLIYLENAGVLAAYESDPLNYFLRYTFLFVIGTFLIYMVNRNIFNALRRADLAGMEIENSRAVLQTHAQTLEAALEENAREQEKQNIYLQTAAEIANNIVTSRNLDEMLNMAVDQIAARFGYYHVGIFLIDENGSWANLRAASSEGGRKMIARGHRLGVGKQGIVGYVTSIGQYRISQDIGLDRIHSVTPELPETRAEMALPLTVRSEILGALDIQDRVPDAFTEEDISALQIIANQVALAIVSMRLKAEAERMQEEVDRAYGEYSQKVWSEAHRQKAVNAYQYSEGELIPIIDPRTTINSENKLEVPILVRGNQIGTIEIAKDHSLTDWTKDEKALLQTLTDQLGIALDSARLFNETQLRATTEKVIGDINAEMWESLDINSILRSTVENLQKTLELPEVSIKMTSSAIGEQTSNNGNSQDFEEN